MSSPLAGRLASSPHTPSSRGETSVQPAVTPGSFSTHSYLPASTTEALEARRAAFFQRQPSSSASSSTATPSSSAPRPPRRPPSSYLRPGPSPATSIAASPQDRSRAFKRPPSALFSGSAPGGSRSSPSRRLLDGGSEAGGVSANDDADNVSSRLYRQRFQQRCQAAIAREKGRQKAITRARGRDVLSSPTSADDGDAHMPLNSDDLSSSDIDDEGMLGGDAWQYEDDELVRRVMLAEYRRLLTKQESSGRHELGWLGADEVAWLEEELARSDERGEVQQEPPADVVDEEAALAEQFDHAFAQEGSEGMEEEGEVWDEDTLRAIEEMESAQQQQQQQQQGDVEMDLA